MKKGILLLLVVSSFTLNAQQKLKDLLYSGKLKTEAGTVIKKDDDLSTKIDTSTKKPVDSLKMKAVIAGDSSAMAEQMYPVDSTATPNADVVITTINNTDNNTPKAKDNTDIWKAYMDSIVSTVNTEVLPSKKLKTGTYFILVDYAIDPLGKVSINNVFVSPENSFLQQQVKERLDYSLPNLSPVLGSNGKPRKAVKKYNFKITKD